MSAAAHTAAALFGAAASVALVVAAAAQTHDAPQLQRDTLRAWAELEPGPAETATESHRLIGFACGPDRLTMTAAEEDHFPTCEAIEPVRAVCPDYEDGEVTAAECARYMGDGW